MATKSTKPVYRCKFCNSKKVEARATVWVPLNHRFKHMEDQPLSRCNPDYGGRSSVTYWCNECGEDGVVVTPDPLD